MIDNAFLKKKEQLKYNPGLCKSYNLNIPGVSSEI